jgi:nucleoside 2-deoxyribosyltransferase
MKIYLSGGLRSGWQDLMPEINGVEYFDPRKESDQVKAIGFVKDDIAGVKESDLVFCYMEKNNPSGLGAAWECAVAAENEIPIIVVWEKSYIDPFFACYSQFLYSSFEEGVKRLVKVVG